MVSTEKADKNIKYMLIDTHAHVNFSAFGDDGDAVARRALAENTWLINVGSQYDTSRRAVEYAQKYQAGVFAAVGLHPIHLRAQEIDEAVDVSETVKFKTEAEKFDYEKYKKLAQNSKVVAIGEVGLDYFRNAENKLLQKEVLSKQISLAFELAKPVIFHCRQAHEDLLEIFKKVKELLPERSIPLRRDAKSKANLNSLTPNNPSTSAGPTGQASSGYKLCGVIHSFSGSWAQARQYLDMGFYLGFNGIITFARDYDRVVREAPLERFILETDCPYLTPVPFRGKRNEPAYVKYVAEKIAQLRGIPFEEVAEVTTANAKKLFGI